MHTGTDRPILDIKSKNPTFDSPRNADMLVNIFDEEVNKDMVRRVIEKTREPSEVRRARRANKRRIGRGRGNSPRYTATDDGRGGSGNDDAWCSHGDLCE